MSFVLPAKTSELMRFLKRKIQLSQLRQLQNESAIDCKIEDSEPIKIEDHSIHTSDSYLTIFETKFETKLETGEASAFGPPFGQTIGQQQPPFELPLGQQSLGQPHNLTGSGEPSEVIKTEDSFQTSDFYQPYFEPKCETGEPSTFGQNFEQPSGQPMGQPHNLTGSGEPSEVVKTEDSYQTSDFYQTTYVTKLEPEEVSTFGKNRRTKSCEDTKNITINYGKAIISFAKSSLAIPYLYNYFSTNSDDSPITVTDFINFLRQAKNDITGIEKFRSMLLVTSEDNARVAACKKAFQWMSEVFIKCFSVNWIMHGKMAYKIVYLKYRSKMLRRVRNPEYFTYVRNVQRQQKKSNRKRRG